MRVNCVCFLACELTRRSELCVGKKDATCAQTEHSLYPTLVWRSLHGAYWTRMLSPIWEEHSIVRVDNSHTKRQQSHAKRLLFRQILSAPGKRICRDRGVLRLVVAPSLAEWFCKDTANWLDSKSHQTNEKLRNDVAAWSHPFYVG